MEHQKIGEMNGLWAFLLRITLALVPIMFASGLGGVVYQLKFNTRVESFMNLGDRYTAKMAVDDHVRLRSEVDQEIRGVERSLDLLRVAMQAATPEASRRLTTIEQSLASIQSDITSMRISIAQLRMNQGKKAMDELDEPKP